VSARVRLSQSYMHDHANTAQRHCALHFSFGRSPYLARWKPVEMALSNLCSAVRLLHVVQIEIAAACVLRCKLRHFALWKQEPVRRMQRLRKSSYIPLPEEIDQVTTDDGDRVQEPVPA
jgi:hypothetical protein